jgi:hypothetical protein
MFNEAETLKWVNAYREEFGLPLLDKIPAAMVGQGGRACMMGTATPGLIWDLRPVAYLNLGDLWGESTLELPEFIMEAEELFEDNELPEGFYHQDLIASKEAEKKSEEVGAMMTPAIIERLRAKLSRNAWVSA